MSHLKRGTDFHSVLTFPTRPLRYRHVLGADARRDHGRSPPVSGHSPPVRLPIKSGMFSRIKRRTLLKTSLTANYKEDCYGFNEGHDREITKAG
jgi:hypothetical protein